MKTTKKSLLASGLSLLVCFALLLGTTFAWFTDSVTNSGNMITSGNLSIDAYAYDLGTDGAGPFTITGVNNGNQFSFAKDGQNLKDDGCPAIISEEKWEPGISSAKLLEVTNNGSLAAKIKLEFTTSGDLTNALWFDFIQVKGNAVVGQFTQRPMSTLSSFAENLELSVAPKDSVQFILVYGMYETAGNEYQNKTFSADVTVLATQDTVEEDGFGSDQYDKGATWAVNSEDELNEALKNATDGDTITLTGNIELENVLNINKNLTLDGGGNAIISQQSVYVNAEDVTLKGITFTSPYNASNNASSIYVTNQTTERLVVDDCVFNDAAWDGIQLTSDQIKEVILTNNTFHNSTKGWRYIHLEPRMAVSSSYADLPDAKLVMTGNTFENVSKDFVGDSAITITGFHFENMTIQGNTFTGKGADSLTTDILWICNGINFNSLLPVTEITK